MNTHILPPSLDIQKHYSLYQRLNLALNYTLLNVLLVWSFLMATVILLDVVSDLTLPNSFQATVLLLVEGFCLTKALLFPAISARIYNKLMES